MSVNASRVGRLVNLGILEFDGWRRRGTAADFMLMIGQKRANITKEAANLGSYLPVIPLDSEWVQGLDQASRHRATPPGAHGRWSAQRTLRPRRVRTVAGPRSGP